MPSPDSPLPNQNHTSKKLRLAPTRSPVPGVQLPQHDQQQALIKCPRCDSSSTKFCYYNNYSLAQPRHFCKTCRRYWTKGGSLRNVPVGGGSRKTKGLKSSSTPSSSKLSQVMFPGANAPNAPTGSIYPPKQPQAPSSSVDPPSSVNPDLHWKLHQQRLAARDGRSPSSRSAPPQPGNIGNGINSAPLSAEWFFQNWSPTYSHINENTICNNWHHRSNDLTSPLDHDQVWE